VRRPQLITAIGHLRPGADALKENATRILLWPTVRANRKIALTKYNELLNELDAYLVSLGGDANVGPSAGANVGPSATALVDIQKIQKDLSGSPETPLDPEKFAESIEELPMNFDKSKLISVAADGGRVIEALRVAFR
jgi:hypothetical protein